MENSRNFMHEHIFKVIYFSLSRENLRQFSEFRKKFPKFAGNFPRICDWQLVKYSSFIYFWSLYPSE